jgi:hypothetical protein
MSPSTSQVAPARCMAEPSVQQRSARGGSWSHMAARQRGKCEITWPCGSTQPGRSLRRSVRVDRGPGRSRWDRCRGDPAPGCPICARRRLECSGRRFANPPRTRTTCTRVFGIPPARMRVARGAFSQPTRGRSRANFAVPNRPARIRPGRGRLRKQRLAESPGARDVPERPGADTTWLRKVREPPAGGSFARRGHVGTVRSRVASRTGGNENVAAPGRFAIARFAIPTPRWSLARFAHRLRPETRASGARSIREPPRGRGKWREE